MKTDRVAGTDKTRSALKTVATALICSLATLGITGCKEDKEAPPLLSESTPSEGRDAFFDALWYGEYERMENVIPLLQAEADAGDASSLAILGFSHSWKLAEYRRDPDADPDIGRHAALAVDAFDAAIRQIPGDARLLGFRGSFLQAQGRVESNQLLTIRGFIDENNAAQRWPAWGLFTKAYGLITLAADDPLYQQGIDALWENIDVCAGEPVNREAFNLADYPALFVPSGDPRLDRPCLNTPVAPHNLEGFFLYFGDMYAKANDLDQAQRLYGIALELDPGDWPYAHVARSRLNRLDELPELFNRVYDRSEEVSVEEINLFESQINCVSCHQGEVR